MPYANNAGVRIHYEVGGAGPPLVLQHGFTMSIESWRTQSYVDALRTEHRLILIDARGHGRSDKPHDEASYALDQRVADVTSVLDTLGVERAHFWGYSMGGWVGYGMAKFAPRRVSALVIGGQAPSGRERGGVMYDWINDGIAHGRDALVAGIAKMVGQPIPDAWQKDLREADLEAWSANVAPPRVGLEDMLGAMKMPCCLYVGEADSDFEQMKAASKQIPNTCFFSLPGLNHVQALYESSKVLPRVMEFLAAYRQWIGAIWSRRQS